MKTEEIFIRTDKNGHQYYCKDLYIDDERIKYKEMFERLEKSYREVCNEKAKLEKENRYLRRKVNIYKNIIKELNGE